MDLVNISRMYSIEEGFISDQKASSFGYVRFLRRVHLSCELAKLMFLMGLDYQTMGSTGKKKKGSKY